MPSFFFSVKNFQEISKLVLNKTDVLIQIGEAKTQGDPLSMLFHGVALLP